VLFCVPVVCSKSAVWGEPRGPCGVVNGRFAGLLLLEHQQVRYEARKPHLLRHSPELRERTLDLGDPRVEPGEDCHAPVAWFSASAFTWKFRARHERAQ